MDNKISSGPNKPKVQVILGSIREGRVGEKVAKWFMESVKENNSAELELVDLLDYPLPVYADSDEVKNREGQHPIAIVEKWLQKITGADGYIIITPEYNHSYSSALKNALDYGYKQWNRKPVGFVGYGGLSGGSRAVEHLRQVVSELQMYGTHEQVLIPRVGKAFDEQGNLINGEVFAKTANKVVDQVAQLSVKLRA